LSPEEQRLLHIQLLKTIPKAHFALKVPGKSVVIVRAPWVKEPKITAKVLEEKLRAVYPVSELHTEVIDIQGRDVSSLLPPLPPADTGPDEDDFDAWQTERPTF
jgi:hypothetical protein